MPAGAAQHDRTHLAIVANRCKGRGQLFYHVDIERVRDIGPVESDDQHAVGLIERQMLCFR